MVGLVVVICHGCGIFIGVAPVTSCDCVDFVFLGHVLWRKLKKISKLS